MSSCSFLVSSTFYLHNHYTLFIFSFINSLSIHIVSLCSWVHTSFSHIDRCYYKESEVKKIDECFFTKFSAYQTVSVPNKKCEFVREFFSYWGYCIQAHPLGVLWCSHVMRAPSCDPVTAFCRALRCLGVCLDAVTRIFHQNFLSLYEVSSFLLFNIKG